MTHASTLTEDRLRRLRVGAQLLHRPDPALSPDALVQRLCGVQAQVLSAAELAVRARSTTLLAADVTNARVFERSVVWTWAMRGTLHLIAADDASWLLPLIAPATLRGALRRLALLGVDEPASEKGVRLIEDMLGDEGPLTREEIAERLARRGIQTQGQAAYHLVRLAALRGVACKGPDRGSDETFVLLRDWVGPRSGSRRDVSLAELARRYLAAYGPATPADLAAWSGLALGEARKGWTEIADELVYADVGGRTVSMLRSRAEEAPPQVVRLLPSFDTYLLGYRNRDFAVARQSEASVNRGGGWLHPVVLADGRAVATWSSERSGDRLAIRFQRFSTLDRSVEEALYSEAHDIGRFLDVDTVLATA